jgi:hypothetical protein
MGRIIDDLYDHEGYAARKLPDGTLTGTWTSDTADFVAFVPACSCAGPGSAPWSEWYGSTEYPPNEAGEDAALAEWERVHARPLVSDTTPAGLEEDVTAFLGRLRELTTERPAAVLGELRRIERATDDLLAESVQNARRAGRSWSEIGSALGMAKQSAQQRFGSRS